MINYKNKNYIYNLKDNKLITEYYFLLIKNIFT